MITCPSYLRTVGIALSLSNTPAMIAVIITPIIAAKVWNGRSFTENNRRITATARATKVNPMAII